MKKLLSVLLSLTLLSSVLLFVPLTAKADGVPAAPENGLPLVVVSIDESDGAIAAAAESDKTHEYGTIDDMNASADHSVRCVGEVTVTVPEGFAGDYGSASVPTAPIKMKYIRGRGNSTWQEMKKRPYKIEFDEPVDLFGMGESTDWALMANHMDDTKVKNRITYKLGESIGMPYCTQLIPVELVMTGSKSGSQYLGLYYLSETVKIEPSRLDIPKLKKNDTDPDAVTGGYLLSLYTEAQNGDEPETNYFTVGSGNQFITKTPEFVPDVETPFTEGQLKQRDYIQNYVSDLDNLIMNSGDIGEDKHNETAEKLDLRSAADYWWLQEFSCNGDAFLTSSTYFYKERGGKLFLGPLWDFDIAWYSLVDSDVNTATGFNNTRLNWLDKLRQDDPRYVALLKERWNDPDDGVNVALDGITKTGGVLDKYKAELRKAWEADRTLWPDEYEMYNGTHSFEEYIETLRTWIEKRREWINANLNKIDRVYHTVTYTVDGDVFRYERIRDKSYVYRPQDAPEKEGFVFKEWLNEKTNEPIENAWIEEDTVAVADYVKESAETRPAAIYFDTDEAWCDLNEGSFFYPSYKVVPFSAVVREIKWSSADESVAYYDAEDGCIHLGNVGDTLITATLRNGVKRSCLVHVFDSDVTPGFDVSGISLEEPKKIIEPGEYVKLNASVSPEAVPLSFYFLSYLTEDSEIIELSEETGVFKALKPGKAKVRVTARVGWGDNIPEYTRECEIIVDHSSDKGTVIKKPTCTAYGLKSYKCKICGQVIKRERLAKLPKKKNPIKVKGKTVKIKALSLENKKLTVARKKAVRVTKAKGKLSFKKAKGNKKISVSKTGKITVKRGLKKGIYKIRIRVTAKGNKTYKKRSKTVTVKIRII
ncbi:MAG: CotH kinase family protein [Eubacterium sp.]|nr:CotH kinase family protein [Eubacterium sp.]